jgi:hypothetical protein
MEFSSILRWPGTSPVSRELPRALAWSTILYRPSHTGLPSLDSRANWHLVAGCPAPSDERHVPVPMVPQTTKTGSAQKTGGIFNCRGQPCREAPLPASPEAPPYQQRYGVIFDDPMQFAFANPLRLPTSGATRYSSQNRFVAGFPPCGRPRVGHSDNRRFDRVRSQRDHSAIDSGFHQLRELFLLASKQK